MKYARQSLSFLHYELSAANISAPVCKSRHELSNAKVGMSSVQLAALIEGFSSFPSVNNGSQAAGLSLPREERRGGREKDNISISD